MADSSSSCKLLEKLDALLLETPPSPAYDEDLNDPEYTKQHAKYHTVTSQMGMNVDYIAQKACEMLRDWPVSKPFRLCSIGCGDGRFDKKVLSKINEAAPTIRIQYLGIDVNEASCEIARSSLGQLDYVDASVCVQDIQTYAPTDVEKCDLIISVHTLYYLTSMEKGLRSILNLLKPTGLVIIVSAYLEPLNELFRRFWLHEQKQPVLFSDSVTHQLDLMGVTYTKDHLKATLDLTGCFKGRFEHPDHKLILDFIIQSKLKCYPQDIATTCIEYLSSIATGKPENFLVAHAEHIIKIRGPEQ